MSVKILLADDQQNIRNSLRALLEQTPDMEVVAEAENAKATVSLARKHKPDVIIMDIGLQNLAGIEASRRIFSDTPGTKVIALSMHADRRYVERMFRAGISGYLLKDCAYEELTQAVGAVLADQIYLSPGIAEVESKPIGNSVEHSLATD